MSKQFPFDVFLCHSSKDTARARDVAELLTAAGLHVWFEEWILQSQFKVAREKKVREGLQQSRVLVFCSSAYAFGTEWAELEKLTRSFRKPVKNKRRFILLLFDDTPIQRSLANFAHISWLPHDRERQFTKLLEACQPPKESETWAQLKSSVRTEARYTNAKVLLVGDNGVGKTALAKRLTSDMWEPSDSTTGAWATQWKLPVDPSKIEREIWLWDFGGQADLRLIHQLYMEDTALAVLVFDAQREDLFEILGHWDRDLTRAARRPFVKLLVAARVDVGGLRVRRNAIEAFAQERGFSGFLETSAVTGQGCDELRKAILDNIRWEDLPWTSTPYLFRRLKDEILALRDGDRPLWQFNELSELLRLRLAGEDVTFQDEELKSVVGLLTISGLLADIELGNYVLFRPEYLNSYAQAVIYTVREDIFERGCLPEGRVLSGDLIYPDSMQRLSVEDERLVLRAMHERLVKRGLCLREQTELGPLLVFPSFYRRERPELQEHPPVQVSYRFKGYLDDIYATLVVRLHHTEQFKPHDLWRYAADFRTHKGKELGFALTRTDRDEGELQVYFDPVISVEERVIFLRYIHEHLLQKAVNVTRFRHYACPYCQTPVYNREVAMRRLEEGKRSIICVNCERQIPLWDRLEELFGSREVRERVRELEKQSTARLDAQSQERVLVGEVISTVALAGQISRELLGSDYGIDMEIEFRDATGQASGRRLYLQLKAGDSYLHTRQRDGAEVFVIRNQRNASYWMNSPAPVMLVIRTSDGQIRWMEVRDWLKRATSDGKKPIKQIVFEGERFDVNSILKWRDLVQQDLKEVLEKQAVRDPDANVRLAAVEKLSTVDSNTRDILLELVVEDPDERVRLLCIKKLIGAWPDEKTRDGLIVVAEFDGSETVRVAACEALSNLWWNYLAVRQHLRRMGENEHREVVKSQLVWCAEHAGKHISKYWATRLSGEKTPEREPETFHGYPGLRISRFRLRNIGPFKDTGEIKLNPDVNVFLGDNASGKTTILRCLALCCIGPVAANEVEDRASTYLRKGAEKGIIEVLFELVPDPDSLPGEVGYFAVGLQILAGSTRFTSASKSDLSLGHEDQTFPTSNCADGLASLRSDSSLPFGFATGYGAVRTFGESRVALQPELKKRENEWVLSLFEPEAPLVNPEVFAKLIRGDTSNIEDAPQNGISDKLVESLQESLKSLFPDVTTLFSETDNDLQLNGTRLLFGELSDGYRSLLALLGHLLRCSLKVRNWGDDPTQIDGITLVDEVDIHLHPAWQVHVAEDIRKGFPNLQLIASTHSPLVVAALKRENVLIMRRQDDGSMTVDHSELSPQGLGITGILTALFGLRSTIDQPTLDKITRRIELFGQRDSWSPDEEKKYRELTEELANLGFNREFSDPYYEQFVVAMAKHHRATIGKLTSDERRELDNFADKLLVNLISKGTV